MVNGTGVAALQANQQPGGTLSVWRGLALLFTLLIVIHNGLHIWQYSGQATAGNPGFSGIRANHVTSIVAVRPGSSAAMAGIVPGDRAIMDRRLNDDRTLQAGDVVGLTVVHGETRRHAVVTAVETPIPTLPPYLAADAVYVVGILLGGLIILRSRNQASSLLLGAALVSYGVTGQWPRLWENAAPVAGFFYVLLNYIYYGSSALMLLATRALRIEASGRDTPGLKYLSWGVIAAHGVLIAVMTGSDLGLVTLPGRAADPFLIYTAPVFAEYALATVTLVLAGREVAPANRNRYAMLLCALLLVIASGVIDGVILSTGNDYQTLRPLLVSWYVAVGAGFLLFAYAVLRHRVIDLGFAVNRTLIYGIMSFIVLLLFGLAEWGIEKVIPEDWRRHLEANAFISAAIALGIFLVFHRIRDVVEEAVEGVFFHKWRANEAQLGRFVRQAAHMLKPATLKAAAVVEFARFSGGAEVAFYSADGARMQRDAGAITGLEPALDADLAPLVVLRAEGKPLFADEAAPLHAALVVPMIQRNELTGFIALGAKPGGGGYRPDERTALAEAAQKIGADLHALRIEVLETKVGDLEATLRHTDHQLRLALKA